VYLPELPTALADVLIGLIGKEASILTDRSPESVLQKPMQVENADLKVWVHHIQSRIESDTRIPETEREALIARRGEVYSNSGSSRLKRVMQNRRYHKHDPSASEPF
jgi:hypothetical protein